MADSAPEPPSVQAHRLEPHLDLLKSFLARRDGIVDCLQELLNAQRKPAQYLQDGAGLSVLVEEGFYSHSSVTRRQVSLRGQLEAAHWADGFKPRTLAGLHNGLFDPAEMMVRAFHMWQQTRWPGRNGRERYAHTLFNVYLLRCLTLASMRIWDDDPAGAADRLAEVQAVLDRLWEDTPADQPRLVRDARWLIQLAQSPATDDLGAYFRVAARIAETLPAAVRLPIHQAAVRMAGGHLRSQLRHYSTTRSVSIDDRALVVHTRSSNALDFALLVQDLVPLLLAYERAVHEKDDVQRQTLADGICQGISPDPELFVNRVDLLGAYSMVEHVFTAGSEGDAVAYTALGRRHVALLEEYGRLIGALSPYLRDDGARFRPLAGRYSPYGAIYGFSSDLIEHITLKVLLPDASSRFGFEDVFSAGDADTLAWVRGWRQLPHLPREVQARFDYPQQFAEDVFRRVEQALMTRASAGQSQLTPTGRIFLIAPGQDDRATSTVPELAARYVRSSDEQLVVTGRAEHCDERRLASDRQEGKFLVGYRTPGGWAAVTKAILSEVLEAGQDVTLTGLPPSAVEVVKLTCRDLVGAPATEPADPVNPPMSERERT